MVETWRVVIPHRDGGKPISGAAFHCFDTGSMRRLGLIFSIFSIHTSINIVKRDKTVAGEST